MIGNLVTKNNKIIKKMIGNLLSRWGAFTSRLLLYQVPSEVCGVQ